MNKTLLTIERLGDAVSLTCTADGGTDVMMLVAALTSLCNEKPLLFQALQAALDAVNSDEGFQEALDNATIRVTNFNDTIKS